MWHLLAGERHRRQNNCHYFQVRTWFCLALCFFVVHFFYSFIFHSIQWKPLKCAYYAEMTQHSTTSSRSWIIKIKEATSKRFRTQIFFEWWSGTITASARNSMRWAISLLTLGGMESSKKSKTTLKAKMWSTFQFQVYSDISRIEYMNMANADRCTAMKRVIFILNLFFSLLFFFSFCVSVYICFRREHF